MPDNDNARRHPEQSKPNDDRDQGASPRVVLTVVIVLSLVFIGGYFLATKLIAMKHQEDCLLSGRKDCIPVETQDRMRPLHSSGAYWVRGNSITMQLLRPTSRQSSRREISISFITKK